MTTEVVILNSCAAVLAADSAVTIRTREGRKTYNSASKISLISRVPPIGSIVYGRSDLLGLPWESLARMYHDRLVSQGLVAVTRVDRVAEGFFKWLRENGKQFFGNACEARARLAAEEELDRLGKAVAVPQRSPGGDGDDDLVLTFIRSRVQDLSVTGDIRDVQTQRKDAEHHYRSLFDELIDNNDRVRSLRLVERETWGEVGRLLADAVRKDALETDSQETGIAFAGLGVDDLRPQLVAYNVHGVLTDQVVYDKREIVRSVGGERPAHIEPLGQTAAIKALLQGVHPNYQKIIDSVLAQLGGRLSGMTRDLLKSRGIDIGEHVSELKETMGHVIDDSLGFLVDIRKQAPLPIINMIADLPTPELVSAAESLVSLTALQQRVGPDLETVGLPVDVAVASRSDGFVWVRRKSYYSVELNRELNRMLEEM